MILSISSTSFGSTPLDAALPEIHAVGFSAVEFVCPWGSRSGGIRPEQTFTEATDALSLKMRQLGMQVSSVFARRLPIDDPAASIQFIERCVELVLRFGGRQVVASFAEKTQGGPSSADASWSTLQELCRRAHRYASEVNIRFVLAVSPNGPAPALRNARAAAEDLDLAGMGIELPLPISVHDLSPSPTLRQVLEDVRKHLASARFQWKPGLEQAPLCDDGSSDQLRDLVGALDKEGFRGPLCVSFPHDSEDLGASAEACYKALQPCLGRMPA